MDGKRFDELSRMLARPRSRRGVSASSASAAVAGALTGGGALDRPRRPTNRPSATAAAPAAPTASSAARASAPTAPASRSSCRSARVGADCPGADTECQTSTCAQGVCGVANAPAGTVLAAQNAGDCATRVCDGNGGVTTVADNGDVIDDGNQCTDDVCNGGVPAHPFKPAGTACSQNGGAVCDGAGACVACVPGTPRACYTGPTGTENVGVCRGGTQTCLPDGSGYGACEGQVLPSAEVCDGARQRLRRGVDKGNPGGGQACNTGLPASAPRARRLPAARSSATRRAAQRRGLRRPRQRLRRRVDNGNPGGGAACNTGRSGVCAAGTDPCAGGASTATRTCRPARVCDGLDNDCNGAADRARCDAQGLPCVDVAGGIRCCVPSGQTSRDGFACDTCCSGRLHQPVQHHLRLTLPGRHAAAWRPPRPETGRFCDTAAGGSPERSRDPEGDAMDADGFDRLAKSLEAARPTGAGC